MCRWLSPSSWSVQDECVLNWRGHRSNVNEPIHDQIPPLLPFQEQAKVYEKGQMRCPPRTNSKSQNWAKWFFCISQLILQVIIPHRPSSYLLSSLIMLNLNKEMYIASNACSFRLWKHLRVCLEGCFQSWVGFVWISSSIENKFLLEPTRRKLKIIEKLWGAIASFGSKSTNCTALQKCSSKSLNLKKPNFFHHISHRFSRWFSQQMLFSRLFLLNYFSCYPHSTKFTEFVSSIFSQKTIFIDLFFGSNFYLFFHVYFRIVFIGAWFRFNLTLAGMKNP